MPSAAIRWAGHVWATDGFSALTIFAGVAARMKVLVAFFLNVAFNFVVGLLVAKFLGPEEYGRFALALATAVAVQTAFLDWLRLGATRFYSERSRGEDPALRATLDVAFALITCRHGGWHRPCCSSPGSSSRCRTGMIALALGAAVANGLFDFNTALVRARFHDGLYVKLVHRQEPVRAGADRRRRLLVRLGAHGADRRRQSRSPARWSAPARR